MATTTTAAEEEKKLPFPLSPAEGWTTVIFAAVLVLITVGCIQSLQWTSGSDILTATTLVGMALGFILAKQHWVPQWLADIPALALGVLFAFYQTARADEDGHLRVLWQHLSAWIASARAGQASSDDAIFLLFLAVLTMLLGYVSMWLIFRSRSPWLAAAANAVVLLINLNYATDDKVIYAVLFMMMALLLIVRFNLVERMRIWKRKGLRYPSELSWDFMQAGVIFTILVIIVAAILPSRLVNVQLQNLWNGPNSPWTNVQNTFSRLFHVDGGNGNGHSRVAFGGSLTIQGNVNLPDTPVFSYTTTDTSHSYLEALTFDHFDGHTWTETTDGRVTTQLAPNTPITPETTVYKAVRSIIHVITAPDGSYIYGPGEPVMFSVPVTVHSDGIPLSQGDQGGGSFTDWMGNPPLKDGQDYTVQSVVSNATVDALEQVPDPTQKPAIYPAALLARYTQLPGDLQDPTNTVRLTALKWAQGGKTMYDRLNLIIGEFEHRFKYNTSNPPVPSDTDAAVWLLKVNQGYCTWFATGFVMMARELGYPARVVEGFIGGDYDNRTATYVVKGTAAHAWAQVYFPGLGWINFEPSASFSSFIRPTKGNGGTNAPPDPIINRPGHSTVAPGHRSNNSGNSESTPGVGLGGGNGAPNAVAISLSMLIAFLLLLALAVVMWWRLLFRKLSPIGRTFARMAVLGRMAGVTPRPAQTAAEYGASLAAQMPEQRAEIETITELYVRERWAPEAPDPAALGDRWRAVRDRLFQRIVRRVPRRFW